MMAVFSYMPIGGIHLHAAKLEPPYYKFIRCRSISN